jgi:hypothetical protein
VVEVARLESVYRFIAYRGFESPSLRQGHKSKTPPSGGVFVFVPRRREASPLRGLRGGFEGIAPTGASLSESSICHRYAVARRRRSAERKIPIDTISSD